MRGAARLHPSCVLVAVILLLAWAAQALGILNSLPTGLQPAAVAVNPLTNKAYVANAGSNFYSCRTLPLIGP